MHLSWIVPLVTVIALLFSIANTVWLWWSKSNDASGKKVEKIECDQDALKERVGKIEGEMKHLPNKEDVHTLKLQVTEIHGQLRTAESELGGVARTVRRIEDHLLGEKA